MIGVIRKERKRRMALLSDDPDVADYVWLSTDEPFINDLCLMLLVAVHHQVEREIVRLAARAIGDEEPLSQNQYEQRLEIERGHWGKWKTRRTVIAKLNLASFPEWDTSMETLRLLANSYKHAPSGKPFSDLLTHLNLDRTRTYAPLVDSNSLREGLAASLDLNNDADYCAIAEELLNRVGTFLAAARQQPGLSQVKRGGLSLFRGHGES